MDTNAVADTVADKSTTLSPTPSPTTEGSATHSVADTNAIAEAVCDIVSTEVCQLGCKVCPPTPSVILTTVTYTDAVSHTRYRYDTVANVTDAILNDAVNDLGGATYNNAVANITDVSSNDAVAIPSPTPPTTPQPTFRRLRPTPPADAVTTALGAVVTDADAVTDAVANAITNTPNAVANAAAVTITDGDGTIPDRQLSKQRNCRHHSIHVTLLRRPTPGQLHCSQ
jgi:hypothetical protein